MFSILGQDLTGLRVLDAFGGSGLLALEAWSRGAEVVCIERARSAWATVTENVRGLDASVEVLRGDVLVRAADLGVFDIVLADPPYQQDPQPIAEALEPCVGTTLVLELEAKRPDPAVPALVLDRRRTYGDTSLCVFVREAR